MLNIISNKDIVQKVEFHLKHGIPYTLEITGSRRIFISERGGYLSRESKFKAKELNFIKTVKEQIIKAGLYKSVKNEFKEDIDKKKIMYFKYNPELQPGDVIKGGYEIDLKSAYWETANKMGLLSPELYQKGTEVSKLARLASIGTLAKRSRTITFDGVRETDLGTTRSEITEFLWDTICYKVGQIMMAASEISPDAFIFFWVDGIFIDKDLPVKDEIVSLFKDFGYNSSVTKFQSIEFFEKHLIVTSKDKLKTITRSGKTIQTDQRKFPFMMPANF